MCACRAVGHSIDQMLKEHSVQRNGTWTAGTNLRVPMQSGDTNVGLFFQDKDQFPSTIIPAADDAHNTADDAHNKAT